MKNILILISLLIITIYSNLVYGNNFTNNSNYSEVNFTFYLFKPQN